MTRGLVVEDYRVALNAHERHVTLEDAQGMILHAREENLSESRTGCCGSYESTVGTEELRAVFESHRDDFNPDARGTIESFLRQGRLNPLPVRNEDISGPTQPGGVKIFSEHARHSTWRCDWFPTTFRPAAPQASLFSEGGVCHFYDLATGKHSQAYELKNHRTEGIIWAGHCDMAARACALLKQPIRSVMFNGKEFNTHKIQGLLVMVSNDLAAANEPFLGMRNNGHPGDDPSEPYPHILMPFLKEQFADGKVVVLDIDNGPPVWNYAYDSMRITEFKKPSSQENMREIPALNGGKVNYYTADMKGTGYDDETRHYKFWIEEDSHGKPLSSGWFGSVQDSKRNPDFAWVPTARGDLTKKENWPTVCTYNPEVDPREVFDIWIQSI